MYAGIRTGLDAGRKRFLATDRYWLNTGSTYAHAVGALVADEAPTATFTVMGTVGYQAGTAVYRHEVLFSEPISGLGLEDFAATNGAVVSRLVAVDGSTRRFTIDTEVQANGAASVVTLLAGAVVDSLANGNPVTSTSVTQLPATPVLALTPNDQVTNASSITVTCQFSAAVTGFDTSDLVVTGATKGLFTAINSTTYTLVLTPAGGPLTVSVAAGAATAGGQGSTAAKAILRSDRTPPTISWSAPAVTNLAAVPVTLTFNEPITGLEVGDVAVVGGALTGLTGGPSVYQLTVAPSQDGQVTLALTSGAVADLAGNTHGTISTSFISDTVPPVISSTPISDALTSSSFQFGVSVTQRGASASYLGSSLWSQVTVTNGTLSGFYLAGVDSANGYAQVSVTDPQVPVTISIPTGWVQDAAGNPSPALTRTFATPPTLTIGLAGGATQSRAAVVPVLVNFSRAITGLEVADFTVSNGTIVGLSGSGAAWTLNVQPTNDGQVYVTLPSNTIQEGNASQTFFFISDRTGPVISVTPTSGAATQTSRSISFWWYGDGSGSTLTPAQLVVANATISAWSFTPGASYSQGGFTLTAVDPSASYGVTFPAGVIQDQAGNGNLQVVRQWIFDSVAPTVAFHPASGVSFTADTPLEAILTFSEPMFTSAMLALDAERLENALQVFGAEMTGIVIDGGIATVSLDPLPGSQLITLQLSGLRDAAGTLLTAPTYASYPVDDEQAPTYVSVSPAAGTILTQEDLGSLWLTFSEGVEPLGSATQGLTLNGGIITAATWHGTSLQIEYEAAVDGPLSLLIAGDAAADGSGNPLPATSLAWTLSIEPPSLSVSFSGTGPTWTATITANELTRFASPASVPSSGSGLEESASVSDRSLDASFVDDLPYSLLEVRGGLAGALTRLSATSWSLPVWAFPGAGRLEVHLKPGTLLMDAQENLAVVGIAGLPLGAVDVPPGSGGTGGSEGGTTIGPIGTTATAANTPVPALLPYQGRLTLDGVPAQGPVGLKFALVDAQGTVRWSHDGSSGEPSQALSVTAVDGAVSAYLGDTATGQAALPPSLFRTPDLRIRVWVVQGSGTVQVSPDLRLGASGYALMTALAGANSVDHQALENGTVTNVDIAPAVAP